MYPVQNFTVVESIYGRFIVNRHCAYQIDHLAKTGIPHIETELRNMFAFVASLPEGSVTVDAGANIGLVSVPVAHMVKEKGGVVHAFEVQRPLYYALCGTTALNDLNNLFCHHMGLGASETELKVPLVDYSKPQDFGMVSLTGQDKMLAAETVPITTIDDLQLPRLDFLKIDVEGMEPEVLLGGRATIATHRPWAWIEYWKGDVADIKAHFAGLNYRFFIPDQLNMLCAPADKMAAAGINTNAPEI